MSTLEQRSQRRSFAPVAAYHERLTVRSYEVGREGCVRPATLLRYLEHIATQDSAARGFDHGWYERDGSAWVVREMSLFLAVPAHMDDVLELATWVSSYRRVQAQREYAVWRPADGRLVARARARWAYIDRVSGQLRRVPEEIIAHLGTLDDVMAPLRIPTEPPTDATTIQQAWEATARFYEADTQQHINNCTYVDWLDEALFAALGSAGQAPGGLPLPRAYQIEYARPVWPADHVRVLTRLDVRGSRRLVARQEITSAETLSGGAALLRATSLHLRPIVVR